MVATKAALSIRVDALTDADGKSDDQAPSIGLENRAKLESRLRALEHQMGISEVRRFGDSGKKQQKFEMTGNVSTYNTTADAVDAVSTQREPVEVAMKAVLDVKEEKRRAKEERRAKRRAEKEANGHDATGENGGASMDVDVESKTDKKRKRRESEADGAVASSPAKVTPMSLGLLFECVLTLYRLRRKRSGKHARRRKKRRPQPMVMQL